jgi:arylsulfatase A-like enzyme
LGLLISVLLGTGGLVAEERRPPNIVYILTDDLGCGDLGCYNKASKISTPNMDRVAAEGMRFTDAHSGSGVCSPTRYGILTGRYAWRGRLKQGVLWGYDPLLIEPGRMTVASLLQKHGYATHCVGKWHLGLGDAKKTDYDKPLRPGPLSVGFDTFFGIPASLDMDPYLFIRDEAPVRKATEKIEASKSRREGGGGFWRAGPIAPGFKHEDVLPELTREALAIIGRHRERSDRRSLFLYLALTSPHTPWMPTKDYQGKSKAGWYGDFVQQTDAVIGQVMMALKTARLEDNTLLIVTSDNGAHWTPEDIRTFNHESANGRRGQKSDIWEGGHRIPFLARWPGKIRPGSTSAELICLSDLLASCAELVGAKLPADAAEDSESILPLLRGKKLERPVHEAVVHHSGGGMFAIRQGEWKLIEGLGSGGFSAPHTEKPKEDGPKGQLYNLARDSAEKENLYLKEPEIVRRLRDLLEKYCKQGHSARRF